MPIPFYGVLKGRVQQISADPASPHYQILVKGRDDKDLYRVAVNVRSTDRNDPLLLYSFQENFTGPVLEKLLDLEDGFTPQSGEDAVTLDYVSMNLELEQYDDPDASSDGGDEIVYLDQRLDQALQQAIGADDVYVYAFGQRWDDSTDPRNRGRDPVFRFRPSRGVHDIHMNQGNPSPGPFANDNGRNQDGALLVQYQSSTSAPWTAVFLAFDTQSFDTDEDGDPLDGQEQEPQ
jgi:uncharacterized protein YukJ